MTTEYFINVDIFRKATDFNDKVDSLFFKQSCRLAQDNRIQETIGTKLYKRLLEGTKNEDLTTTEQTLIIDYIADPLIYWTYWYALESLRYKPRNGRIVKGQTSLDEALTESEYEGKRRSIEEVATSYTEILRKYLIENHTLFPEYSMPTELHEFQPEYDAYSASPIVFEKEASDYDWVEQSGIRRVSSKYPWMPQ